MTKLLLGIGYFTVFSLIFWAFSGLTLWAPVTSDEPRAMLLFLLHCAGLVALVAGALRWVDQK